MAWITGVQAAVISTLNTDILMETAAATRFLNIAQCIKQVHDHHICHEIALCAAAALSNATSLAAEVAALGGTPAPCISGNETVCRSANSVDEHVSEAREALTHYLGRLVFAKRLGLPRLEEVFREIVESKRRHLAHASVIAAACLTRRKKKNWRNHNANRSAYE